MQYKTTTFGALASDLELSKETLFDYLTETHMMDMIQLGWKPRKYTVIPAVAKYINEVVMNGIARKTAFPDLLDYVKVEKNE